MLLLIYLQIHFYQFLLMPMKHTYLSIIPTTLLHVKMYRVPDLHTHTKHTEFRIPFDFWCTRETERWLQFE